jgi:argininosuccinate lyase
VNTEVLEDSRYDHLYTVDSLHQRVLNGVPFRDAYREMAEEIAAGTYTPEKHVRHTHLGSKDNLALDELREKLKLFSDW